MLPQTAPNAKFELKGEYVECRMIKSAGSNTTITANYDHGSQLRYA